jgi:simple sugar transport system ATP-binding protein
MVEGIIKEYSIVCSSPTDSIMNLSGGNVQKCILSRELNLAKKLIIAEEPTRGVDIGAIEFIHNQLIKKSREGYGVILVSTDLDEIIALSTKIIVMFEGRIVGQIDPDAESLESKIGLMMAGATS